MNTAKNLQQYGGVATVRGAGAIPSDIIWDYALTVTVTPSANAGRLGFELQRDQFYLIKARVDPCHIRLDGVLAVEDDPGTIPLDAGEWILVQGKGAKLSYVGEAAVTANARLFVALLLKTRN